MYFPHLNSFWKYTACWAFVLVGLLPFCYVFYRVIEKPGIRLGTWVVIKMEKRGVARLTKTLHPTRYQSDALWKLHCRRLFKAIPVFSFWCLQRRVLPVDITLATQKRGSGGDDTHGR